MSSRTGETPMLRLCGVDAIRLDYTPEHRPARPPDAQLDLQPPSTGLSIEIEQLMRYAGYPHANRRTGHGMRLLKEGLLESTARLWKNPDDAEDADVYIKFTVVFDMKDDPGQGWEAYRLIKVKDSWISGGSGCGYDFCLQGEETAVKVGTLFAEPDNDYTRIVVSVPHIIDHAATLRLYHKARDSQNTLVIDTSINNSNNHYTPHKCEPDGRLHAWHNHSSGSAGHLPVGGLL